MRQLTGNENNRFILLPAASGKVPLGRDYPAPAGLAGRYRSCSTGCASGFTRGYAHPALAGLYRQVPQGQDVHNRMQAKRSLRRICRNTLSKPRRGEIILSLRDLVQGGNSLYRRLRYASPTVNKVLPLQGFVRMSRRDGTLLTAGEA
jgi:hypothetical protein